MGTVQSKESEVTKDILTELNIKSIQDLRKYVLYQWLELSQSDEAGTRILALKEMSRYLFNTSGACIVLGNDLENEDLIY
jgi:hypothetical protein